MRRPLLACALALAPALLACSDANAQNFTGHWTYHDGDETAELDLRPGESAGRVSGTLEVPGLSAPIAGRVAGGTLVVEEMNGVGIAQANLVIGGRMAGGKLILTIAQQGGQSMTMAMERTGLGGGAAAALTRNDQLRRGMAAIDPDAFTGQWQMASPDGTYAEELELRRAGDGVTGSIRGLEHGYFSGRTTVKAEMTIEGSGASSGRGLALTVTDQESGNRVQASAERRGEYLILRIGGNETPYARPGVSLVRDASGSPEAAALARAIRGNVYVASTQASGRGAFVGKRTRLALCADGEIQFSTSDLASAPGGFDNGGVDFGGSTSRRGGWEIVLYGGAPAVHARWEGTGTSYALDRYFTIVPGAGGRITVDGTPLPLQGHC